MCESVRVRLATRCDAKRSRERNLGDEAAVDEGDQVCGARLGLEYRREESRDIASRGKNNNKCSAHVTNG